MRFSRSLLQEFNIVIVISYKKVQYINLKKFFYLNIVFTIFTMVLQS